MNTQNWKLKKQKNTELLKSTMPIDSLKRTTRERLGNNSTISRLLLFSKYRIIIAYSFNIESEMISVNVSVVFRRYREKKYWEKQKYPQPMRSHPKNELFFPKNNVSLSKCFLIQKYCLLSFYTLLTHAWQISSKEHKRSIFLNLPNPHYSFVPWCIHSITI